MDDICRVPTCFPRANMVGGSRQKARHLHGSSGAAGKHATESPKSGRFAVSAVPMQWLPSRSRNIVANRRKSTMLRRQLLLSAAALAAARLLAGPAAAQDTVKIGLIVPMTGQQASTGKQIDAAVKLYQAQHGTTVAGKKIEVILKDDARGAGQHQAHRAGTDRQRQGQLHRRLRRDAGRARRRAARHAGEGPADRDGGRHLDHHRALALHRAHQLHAGAVVRDHRGLGAEEQHQEGRHHGVGLRARRRRREVVLRTLQGGRRRDRRGDQASRSPTRTSRRSCSAPPTPSPMRCSSSCRPARAAPS